MNLGNGGGGNTGDIHLEIPNIVRKKNPGTCGENIALTIHTGELERRLQGTCLQTAQNRRPISLRKAPPTP